MIDPDTLAPLVVASRTLLGLVFLTAAAGKFRDPASFHGAVHAYRLLTSHMVGSVAFLIPCFEVAIGVLLPSGLAPIIAASCATLMLIVFASAMAANIARGYRHIDCGCFSGRPSRHLTWGAVVRTLALAATAAFSGILANASVAAATQGLVAGAILFLLFVTASTLPTFGRQRPRISL